MYKVSEVKNMTNDEIVTSIFYMGIACSNERGTKADDVSLQRLITELGRRGVVEDPQRVYEDTLK